MKTQLLSCVFLMVLAASELVCFAQTAELTGTVMDQTGGVILGASITATNIHTGIRRDTTSNEKGCYSLPFLQPGTYRVNIQTAGFKPISRSGIQLIADQVCRIDFLLELGELTELVEISTQAALIETETARVSETKSAELLRLLPQNWFRFSIYYLALTPNVVQGDDGSYRFAGSRDNQAQFTIDGTTANDGVTSFIGPQFGYLESVQELKVGTANNTAEYGTLGQFTVISKSGTNRFHGSLFDYYVTPWFRARNPFATERDAGIVHFPGFSAGGPVFLPGIYNGKNKTFFFTSFETSRGNSTVTFLDPTVPLSAWRQGDFSGLATLIRDPLTGQPFPGNRIPQERLNPVSVKIQDRFYPLPNFGDASVFNTQNYRESKVQSWNPVDLGTVRLDHHLSGKDVISGRLTWTRGHNRYYDGNLPAIGRIKKWQRDTRSVTGSYTHTFNPNLLNEFRYGLAFNNIGIHGSIEGKPLAEELGLTGLAPSLPDISGILKVFWTDLPLQRIQQTDYVDPGYRNFLNEFSDHMSWLRGHHTFKLGGAFTRVTWSDYSARSCLFGCVTFSDRFTGFDYADFLLGYPTTVSRAFAPLKVVRERSQYDLYVSDDFKVSHKLTLNLGVRYEYHPYWTEANGLGSMFDIDSARIVVPDGSFSKVSPLFPFDYADVVEASQTGLESKTLISSDKNNVAPRIGVAYRPWGNTTVIRAGFGVYYDMGPRDITFGGLPYVLDEPPYTNPVANPSVIFPRVFPASGPDERITKIALPSALNPRLKIPYSLQYNFTVEHSH
jgi:carboxypeptidase family protein/TonB-dependent receptor-like protein